MKLVYVAVDLARAEIIRGMLADAGIRAIVEGEMLQAAVGDVPFTAAYPRISVDDADFDAARRVIADSGVDAPPKKCAKCGYDIRGLSEPRCPECGEPFPAPEQFEPWTCPTCGESIEGQFAACWQCGADAPSPARAVRDPAIRILDADDQHELENYLGPRLREAMFLLSNSRAGGIVDTGKALTGTYAAEFRSLAIAGVVAHFWNGMLIPCAPPESVVALARTALEQSGRPLRGLIGPQSQVEALAAALAIPLKQPDAPLPSGLRLDSIEGLYELVLSKLKVPEPLARGEVTARRATKADLPLLIDWDIRYAFESLGATDLGAQRPISESYQQRFVESGHAFLLEAAGRPVARTLFNAAIKEAVQVGGVWTLPELRGRGYARAVVAGSLIAARAEGVERAILFTEHTNTAARRAYAALGFERVGDFRLVFLK